MQKIQKKRRLDQLPMKKRLRIPISLVEKHFKDVFFLVDTDYTYVQAIVPRVIWLRTLGYKINMDEAFTTITTFFVEDVDPNAIAVGNYDVAKSKIIMDLKTTSVMRKKNKIFKKLKEKFEDMEKEEEDDDEESEGLPTQAPLAITQGQGEDHEEEVEIEEGAKGEEASEAPTVTEKKKEES